MAVILLKYAKKHSLKTLDAIQLSVVKSINEPEVKAVVLMRNSVKL
jgi:hypothetical protein